MHTQSSGKMQNDTPMAYDFSIDGLISEAWQRVKGVKATYWGAVIIYLVIHLAVLAVMGGILGVAIYIFTGSLDLQDSTVKNYFTMSTDFGLLLVYPILIGVYSLGIRRAADLSIEASMIFNPYQKFFRIIGTLLLTYLCIFITLFIGFFIYGILLAISQSHDLMFLNILSILVATITVLATLYLGFAFIFAPLLVYEKNMGILKAMRASICGFSQHWFKIIVLNVVMIIILIISAIPVLIGYIWTIPMALNLFGVLYRTIFGVENK